MHARYLPYLPMPMLFKWVHLWPEESAKLQAAQSAKQQLKAPLRVNREFTPLRV
jgi:hypothetical protein